MGASVLGLTMSSNPVSLRTRPLVCADMQTVVQWMASEWSLPKRATQTYATLFASLIDEGRIFGGCIETLAEPEGIWTIAGIGMSAFVSEAAIKGYLEMPVPFPSLVLLEQARSGARDVLLDETAVARANAGAGLDMLSIYYGQTSKDPTDPEWRRTLQASVKLSRELHSGYHLRRVLQDEWSSLDDLFLAGGFRVYRHFGAGTPCPAGLPPLARARSLVGLTATEAASQQPGTVGALMFEFRVPLLQLSTAERRLLVHAVSGLTDEEIARVLDLSPNTLKATWRRIYTSFDGGAPFALRRQDETSRVPRRGREKRRQVITYVREHPEELRPWGRH